ncbi:hypothetical protein WN944_028610 [Citrus x changshan-huyou]
MRSKANMQSKFKHYMEKPRKILHKARDFYVKSMEDCANMISYGGVMAGPGIQVSNLQRSFSVNYSNSRNKETFREASAAVNNKIRNDKDLNYVKEKELERQKLENRSMKRSYTSAGLGKIRTIDEDKPCNFEDDMIYARSRSWALRRNF